MRRALLLAALAAGLAAQPRSHAAPDAPADVLGLVEQAQAKVAAREWADAAALWDRVIRLNPVQPAYWYSDLAALTFGFASPTEPGIVETTSRRPPAVRTRSGDVRRRESGAPMSLDPPQN